MTDTRPDRRIVAGFFLQERPPRAANLAAFNLKLAASGLVAVDPVTFAADLYRRANAIDVAIASGTDALTSAAAPWTADDVGKKVYVQGAGVAGATLVARILAYVNPGSVTLDTNAATTVSGAPTSALVGVAVWGYTLDQISTDASYAQNSAGVTLADVGNAIAAHVAAADPHADRAYGNAQLGAAIGGHIAADDPHGDRAFAASLSRWYQRTGYQLIDTVGGYPNAELDDTLQCACVLGEYIVEADLIFTDQPYVPSIACDVLIGGQQMAYGLNGDTGAAAILGLRPDLATSNTPVPIAPALNSVAGGVPIAFSRTPGQTGVVHLRGHVATSGPGTIGIIHCNQLGIANIVSVCAGSWMRVTRIL